MVDPTLKKGLSFVHPTQIGVIDQHTSSFHRIELKQPNKIPPSLPLSLTPTLPPFIQKSSRRDFFLNMTMPTTPSSPPKTSFPNSFSFGTCHATTQLKLKLQFWLALFKPSYKKQTSTSLDTCRGACNDSTTCSKRSHQDVAKEEENFKMSDIPESYLKQNKVQAI
jgi:hypothetical protein